jgi:hypothetical protein
LSQSEERNMRDIEKEERRKGRERNKDRDGGCP